MAAILGVSCFYHDSAAALVVDGKLVAAIQEERLSRIKNDAGLPLRAAAACLRQGGIAPGALDAVVYYENPYRKLERVVSWLLRGFPASGRHFARALSAQLGSKLWVLDRLAEGLGVLRARVRSCEHHLSHAASAFLVSPFEEAAVLTIDGVGEDATTSIYHGRGSELTLRGALHYPHSLGLLYAALTAYLGFEVNEGEHKVMGLSAYGTPRFRDLFAKLVESHADGSFELRSEYFQYESGGELGFSPALERLLGPRRVPGVTWNLEGSEADRRYADIAATLQTVTEELLLGLARRAKRETGADALCLAGGVALNAVANRRILKEAGFPRVFVQPAAGDAGGALGAALWAAVEQGDGRAAPLTHCAWGEPISASDAVALAEPLGLRSERVSDPSERLVGLLGEGAIVGWCQGRFEWGPRALGQRSLLARPDRVEVRQRLNQVIKRRSAFQPFAPVVAAASAARWFQDAPNDMTPFMTSVCEVQSAARESLAAVTHVDGSARVQTLTAGSADGLLHALTALERAGHLPVALNTSLNGKGEPIVAHATDAVAFLASHEVDALLIEDVLLRRPG